MVASVRLSGTAIRAVAVALPTSLLVIFAGLLVVLGMFTGKDRREYALKAATVLTDLAKVLVGIAQPPAEESRSVRSLSPPDGGPVETA